MGKGGGVGAAAAIVSLRSSDLTSRDNTKLCGGIEEKDSLT